MIHAYLLEGPLLQQYLVTQDNSTVLRKAVWIDLIAPTPEENVMLQSVLTFNLPEKDDVDGIEISRRLYKEGDLFVMTASILAHSESREPILDIVSFILTKMQLITIRYYDLQAFKVFTAQVNKNEINGENVNNILIELLEAITDRTADILERVGESIDRHSQMIFRPSITRREKINFQHVLQEIGANGDLNAKHEKV